MVSGSVKGHELCRLSDIGWSSLGRGEEWVGREDVGFVLLDGLGGVMREESLGSGGLSFWGTEWGMVGDKVVVWLSCGGGASYLGGGFVMELTGRVDFLSAGSCGFFCGNFCPCLLRFGGWWLCWSDGGEIRDLVSCG